MAIVLPPFALESKVSERNGEAGLLSIEHLRGYHSRHDRHKSFYVRVPTQDNVFRLDAPPPQRLHQDLAASWARNPDSPAAGTSCWQLSHRAINRSLVR